MIKALFLIFILFLTACGGVKDALTGTKKPSTDEFLVEKKNPLVMPPDYGKLPEPIINQTNQDIEVSESEGNIKDLISNKENTSLKNNQTKPGSLEESILEKIN
jgi:hypothetical protein